MLSLKDFKAVKIENDSLSSVIGGKEYTKNPDTGSTVDILTDTYYEDATGRYVFSCDCI